MSVLKRLKTAADQQSLLQAAIHGRRGVFGASSWDQLPVEILVVIFGFLDVNDKLSVMTVCERWYAATNVPSVWKDTWVGLKHGLESRSMHFWYALQLRQLSYIALKLRAHTSTKDIAKLHSVLPQVKGLDLRLPNLNRDHISLEQLTKFKEVVTLKLSFTATFVEASSIGSLLLKDMTQLQSLKLSYLSGLSCNDNLTFLAHATLRCLELESCGSFNARDIEKILVLLPNLVDLRVHNCSFYGGFIKQQSQTALPVTGRDLTRLSLAGTRFDGARTFFPSRLLKLTSLHLMFCEQRKEQIANMLSSLYHLEELNVRGNFCGDDVLKDLKCPLRSIDLAINQNITLHGIEQLSQSVSGSLRHLGLARCVGLMACKGTLLNRLSELFPSLVSLDLCGWQLTRENVRSVSEIKTLRLISLLFNDIQPEHRQEFLLRTKIYTILS